MNILYTFVLHNVQQTFYNFKQFFVEIDIHFFPTIFYMSFPLYTPVFPFFKKKNHTAIHASAYQYLKYAKKILNLHTSFKIQIKQLINFFFNLGSYFRFCSTFDGMKVCAFKSCKKKQVLEKGRVSLNYCWILLEYNVVGCFYIFEGNL